MWLDWIYHRYNTIVVAAAVAAAVMTARLANTLFCVTATERKWIENLSTMVFNRLIRSTALQAPRANVSEIL